MWENTEHLDLPKFFQATNPAKTLADEKEGFHVVYFESNWDLEKILMSATFC